MFIGATSTAEIRKVPIGGGAVTTLATGQPGPLGIAVDQDFVYVALRGGNQPGAASIAKVPKQGGAVVTLAPNRTLSFEVMLDGGDVLFSDQSAGIFRVPKSGGAVTPLVTASSVDSFTKDATHFYWTEAVAGLVRRAPIAGGAAEDVVTGQSGRPFTVRVDATNVYWENYFTGEVRTIAK
jgi:hypothetical protein